MLVLTAVIALVYTGALTLIGQLAFPSQSNGSLIENGSGKVIASKYIGQSFTDAKGHALPQYFQSRPSATTNSNGDPMPYNAASSSGSNLGPTSPELLKLIRERKQAVAQREHVSLQDVPADAVTASASGLDYQISPEYASIQVNRVAKERGMSKAAVTILVKQYTTNRALGFIGERAVNVVELNLALDHMVKG